MVLPPPVPELDSLINETFQSLQSLENVLSAIDIDLITDTTMCIVYVTSSKYFSFVKRVWEQKLGKNAHRVPTSFVAVPMLPRKAKVEWQVLVWNSASQYKRLIEKEERRMVGESSEEEETPDQFNDEEDDSRVEDVVSEVGIVNMQQTRRGTMKTFVVNAIAKSVVTNEVLTNLLRTMIQVFSEALTLSATTADQWTTSNVISIRLFHLKTIAKEIIAGLLSSEFEELHWETKPSITFIPTEALLGNAILSLCIHAANK